MELKINIERKHLLYTVFLVAIVGGVGLGVAFTTTPAGPSIMGHTADEIFCLGCITDDNIADNADINGSKIEAGTIPASALESGGGGSITTYRLTASSGSSSQTSSYDCTDGDSDATLTFCADAGRDSSNNPYCICNTDGSTATLTAMAKRYTWSGCGGGWASHYTAVGSCTPFSGGCTGSSCSGVSCEMLFQCNELIDVP